MSWLTITPSIADYAIFRMQTELDEGYGKTAYGGYISEYAAHSARNDAQNFQKLNPSCF
jgi:hypothetical protein